MNRTFIKCSIKTLSAYALERLQRMNELRADKKKLCPNCDCHVVSEDNNCKRRNVTEWVSTPSRSKKGLTG